MFTRSVLISLSCISFLTAQTTVTVSTAEELIKAIGSNKTIYLNGVDYDLTDQYSVTTNFVSWEGEYDGSQMVITNVKNLKIVGGPNARVLVSPQYTWVMKFVDSENITLDNFTMGHTQGGYCTGGVVNLNNCTNVKITSCKLFGSGTYGMEINDSKNITLEKSDVYKCTYGLLVLNNSTNCNFIKTRFRETGEFDLVTITNCSAVNFKTCVFEKNYTTSNYFFRLDSDYYEEGNNQGGSSNITINTCIFRDNKVPYFTTDYTNKLIIGDNRFERNDFGNVLPTAVRAVQTKVEERY